MELVKVVNGSLQLPQSATRWLGREDELAIEVAADALVLKKVRTADDEDARDIHKLEIERDAFLRQHPSLLAQYRGEYVAMHEQRVIDHDPDIRTLHLRVFDRLGRTPVLLKQVTDEPERELVFRSPHFVREPT